MSRSRVRTALSLAAPFASAGALLACGARTGLFAEPPRTVADAGIDSGAVDATVAPFDATIDAPYDADANTLSLIDAAHRQGPPPKLCSDAGTELIYVFTEANTLATFDPTTSEFKKVGTLACADADVFTPFSMAVDPTGAAYVLYAALDDSAKGAIFKADLTTLKCTPTAFDGGDPRFWRFGMGFSVDDGGASETLYIAGYSPDAGGSILARLEGDALSLSSIGAFAPAIAPPELAGTADGRLFAFYTPEGAITGSAIAEIDRSSAALIANDPLPSVSQGQGWAFGSWGGDFYLFTGEESAAGAPLYSAVTRFRPSDLTTVVVATYPELIVGAGASTCAPTD